MDSAAPTLVSNVGQLLAAEYRQLSGVGGEIAELRDDLETMNALLRMQFEAEEGAVDHFVRVWMKQLRELAYDAEDYIDLYLLRIKCRPGEGVRARFKHLLATLFSRRRLASEISALRTRALAIGERHARYGVDREALRRSRSVSAAPLLAASVSAYAPRRANDPGSHQLVGIEDQVNTLAGRLKARVDGEQHLKVFSIVGFGGLGKTTLALEVCRRLEADFECQAMVSVSQAFDPGRDLRSLLKRVLLQVVESKTDNEKGIKEEGTLGDMDGLDDDKLVKKLEELLNDKRYLVVIDDVWTIRAWDAIQSKLPENNCSSRIVVTTRIETVAKSCSPASVNGHYIHHMESLKLEDSKKLFRSRVFGSVSASYPKELVDVMSNILKKCNGMPLAIVSISSVLAGYTSPESKEKWETICRSIGSQMERFPTLEGMRQIVTLSYNHLPYELKACMMYLSIFPEDYEINKDRLLRRWVAEGLVLEKWGLTLMEVAESYFDELLSRNMIELRVHYVDHEWMEFCRVHDMLLEVMVSRSLECNFVSLLGGQYAEMSYDRIRRLSIQGDDNRVPQSVEQSKKMSSRCMEGMDVKHVRSLSMFQLQGHKVLNHIERFTLLRVLDLEDCESLRDNHMRYICRLYLLRFLSVKGTNITKVPPQVGKLEHLQTLDTRGTLLDGLPETVTNLEKLERIMFRNKQHWYVMWNLPRGLRKMKALREVDIAFLEDDIQVVRELGELQQLQSIQMYIQCDDYDDEVLKELGHSLGKMYSLRRLGIAHIKCGAGEMTFLHNLRTPPRLLRYLRIEGNLDKLPLWLESLSYLVHVDIMHTKLSGDQVYGVLCKLPNLKSIIMNRQFYRDIELVARRSHNFQALTYLTISTDSEMPKVLRFEQGSMEKLEKLHVYIFTIDRTILGIEHLTSLKEVQLKGNKQNPAVYRAMDQLKAENRRRLESNQSQFQVVVRYE